MSEPFLKELDAKVARLAETTGKIRMQRAILQWLVDHREQLSQLHIEQLIRLMEAEVQKEEE